MHLKQRSLPFYVTLPDDVISQTGILEYPKALESGLRALKCIGIGGVVVEVWWGVVEGSAPLQYDWRAYGELFQIIQRVGLRVRACICFHSNGIINLPAWVLEVGRSNPDIFFADRSFTRRLECLSIGVDELPVLRGRSGVQCASDFMANFHLRFHQLLGEGSMITSICIGLGPNGELRYPSFPAEHWNFPGVGEFQCYDRYMLSVLQAAALACDHPEYGRDGGPHDAGTYCMWPHQTKFFRDDGSWASEYGQFFLLWYSQYLLHHAERMLEVACDVFGSSPVRLEAKLPVIHWWHHTASHAAELTAGINHSAMSEGYVPIVQLLRKWNCHVLMSECERHTGQQPPAAACNPEELILHVRTCASVNGLQVGLENTHARFDEAAFSKIEQHLFDRNVANDVHLSNVASFTFNQMGDVMFEPFNWHRFKAFILRLTQRLEQSPPERVEVPAQE